MANNNDFKIDGEILYIDKERPSKEGSTFMLRDFCLEMAVMGESNHVKCQLKGTNTGKIDGFLPGDAVTVSFSLLGMAKPKDDKIGCDTNPKKFDSFSPNVNAWKIEFQPGFQRVAKMQQPQNQTQNKPNQATAGTPPTGSDGKPQIWNATENKWVNDDLPF